MVHPLNFVIIEDDASSADAMRLLLERRGHKVALCLDSLSAVDTVAAAKPDVVLADIMMPYMDGIEICRRLHTMPALKGLKSVIVTGKTYDNDRTRALAAGARGVILKPLDPKTFVNEVLGLVNDELVMSYWGVRGLLPATGPNAHRYGGNTSCVTMELPGEQLLIFDAGTGIKAFSDSLAARAKPHLTAQILISHPHWDHINGLPFFGPLFVRGNEFEIMGPSQGAVPMRQLVAAQFDPLYSAVTLRELAARVFFRDLAEMSFDIGSVNIKTLLLAHPGNCLGYRVTYKGRSVCYIPDTELPARDAPGYNQDFERRLVEFMAGADVALMAAQTEGLPGHAESHASVARVAEVAHEAGVGELQLFHHTPAEDDRAIDRKLADASAVLAGLHSKVGCSIPAEGARMVLGCAPAQLASAA